MTQHVVLQLLDLGVLREVAENIKFIGNHAYARKAHIRLGVDDGRLKTSHHAYAHGNSIIIGTIWFRRKSGVHLLKGILLASIFDEIAEAFAEVGLRIEMEESK